MMNVSSSEVRDKFKIFDTLFNRVSAKALLRDEAFSLFKNRQSLEREVRQARLEMARILKVSIEDLPTVHTGENGRFDCDDYAALGISILKAMHDVECRQTGSADEARACWSMSRKDVDHTQGISIGEDGLFIIEWITGEIEQITDANKPIILLIG